MTTATRATRIAEVARMPGLRTTAMPDSAKEKAHRYPATRSACGRGASTALTWLAPSPALWRVDDEDRDLLLARVAAASHSSRRAAEAPARRPLRRRRAPPAPPELPTRQRSQGR